MPLAGAHLNGSVNLPDGETVMRELAVRLGPSLQRVTDGETGDRQNWIYFQLEKFRETPGLELASNRGDDDYDTVPKLRLADDADPDALALPDLGYATAYQESFQVFCRLRDSGILPDVRFQVQYPTPLASIHTWIVAADQVAVFPAYKAAMFADLQRLLASVPHDQLAVQWDVAVELAVLEGATFAVGAEESLDSIVDKLVTCVNEVPADIPVGMHLCYGDRDHRHWKEPESLDLQVRITNGVAERASRPLNFVAFTVPQNQSAANYFAPLSELEACDTELYFGIVPYHPADQPPGTTDEQVRLIEAQLGNGTPRSWGVSTECGLGRVDRDELPALLDLHLALIKRYQA
jgi:hypothetical protein